MTPNVLNFLTRCLYFVDGILFIAAGSRFLYLAIHEHDWSGRIGAAFVLVTGMFFLYFSIVYS